MPLRAWVVACACAVCGAKSYSSIPNDGGGRDGGGEKTIYIIRHGEKIAGDVGAGQLAHEAQCLSQKGWARAYHLLSVFGRRPRPPFATPDALFACDYTDPLDCRDASGAYRAQQTLAPLAAASPSGLNLTVDNSTSFMPDACGLAWHPHAKPGYVAHKAGGQPPPYNETIAAWTARQPEDAASRCYPQGFGAADDGEDVDDVGVCCNAAAASAMRAKLREPGVRTILVAWEHANIGYLATALSDGRALFEAAEWAEDDYDRVVVIKYTADGGAWRSTDRVHFFQGFDYAGNADGEHLASWLGPSTYCGALEGTTYPVTYPVFDSVQYQP